MPIYEYQCRSCNHQFDALQKISDEPLTLCPACQTDNLVKLVSAAGFQLKGTGWYATDFRDKRNTNTTATDEKQSGNGNTTSSTETSTKDKPTTSSTGGETT